MSPKILDNTQDILNFLLPKDPNFNLELFIQWVKKVFVIQKKAWMERDLVMLQLFETPELYNQHAAQLQKYIDLGRINVFEFIAIDEAYLQQYIIEKEHEYLVVFLDTHMYDYVTDIQQKKIFKGDKTHYSYQRYLYTFMRRKGTQSNLKTEGYQMTCPNCGAPMKLNVTGKCEYCGFYVIADMFGWALSEITLLKPEQSLYNNGVIYR